MKLVSKIAIQWQLRFNQQQVDLDVASAIKVSFYL